MSLKAALENEIRWPRRVVTPAEAVKFIDAAGFCMLLPVKSVPLPSLYYAVTRRNPHQEMIWDKYSQMVWRWKDELPRRRRVFYAKYFRGRGTFISLAHLPYFLAMREAALDPRDHERFYTEGRIRDDARVIWQALEEHGPLATLELRNICKMDTKAGNVRFKRAIVDLQCALTVVHFGAEQETAAASDIAPERARAKIAAKFLEWRPDVPPAQLARLFGWSRNEATTACASARPAVRKPIS